MLNQQARNACRSGAEQLNREQSKHGSGECSTRGVCILCESASWVDKWRIEFTM